MYDKIIIASQEFLKWEANKKLVIDSRPAETTYIGHIKDKNVKLIQTINGSVVIGSIPKYLKGQNMTGLTLEETEIALKELQNDLGIDFEKATVKSLEIGLSLIMNKTVKEYLLCFGDMVNSRYKKYTVSSTMGIETVLYKTKTGGIEFIAYNKTAEMYAHKDGEKIPKDYQCKNVIRLELKIKNKRILKSVLGKELKPFDLCSEDIFKVLKSRFRKSYNAIYKIKGKVDISISENMTPAKIIELFACAYMQDNNDKVNNILGIAREKGFLNKNTIDRLRVKMKRLNRLSKENELIYELDEKLLLEGF